MTDNDLEEHRVINGEVPDVFEQFEDNSFHAVVTDPPYALGESNNGGKIEGFMGSEWDSFSSKKQYQLWTEEWSKEVMRILKPGGHMLVFSGDTTYHRMASGIEDAGFDYRSMLAYLYGGGFPKGQNIEKQIDKKLGKEDEREITGEYQPPNGATRNPDKYGDKFDDVYYDYHGRDESVTAPASDLAKKFEGFNSQLKPSLEPIALARNPLGEDTIAENVMEYGTGGLNIDACRISTDEEWEGSEMPDANEGVALEGSVSGELNQQSSGSHEEGRYPANLALSHSEECSEEGCVEDCPVAMLDEQSGVSSSHKNTESDGRNHAHNDIYGEGSGWGNHNPKNSYNGEGGASRFFYTSKASKSERTADGKVENNHPTVKNLSLMEWLVKMVTAEGQEVLDPFLGSGTTLIAAENTGRICTGIEQSEEYCELARERAINSCDRLMHNSALDW